MNVGHKIAKYLLQIQAVKLEPSEPFTWASGWKSPIYCDNRKTLSYPEIRQFIAASFIKKIQKKHSDTDVIAGVATGAIAHGVLVAEALNLPFVYIRTTGKSHGLQNKIEGTIVKGQKVVVIEDLVSTGSSSLKVVDVLRKSGCKVLGMFAIFSYGFNVATHNFENANCKLITLTNYDTLIEVALQTGAISQKDITVLRKWRKNPSGWGLDK